MFSFAVDPVFTPSERERIARHCILSFVVPPFSRSISNFENFVISFLRICHRIVARERMIFLGALSSTSSRIRPGKVDTRW